MKPTITVIQAQDDRFLLFDTPTRKWVRSEQKKIDCDIDYEYPSQAVYDCWEDFVDVTCTQSHNPFIVDKECREKWFSTGFERPPSHYG